MSVILTCLKQRDGVCFEFELFPDATVLAEAPQHAHHLMVVPKRIDIHANDMRWGVLYILVAHLGAASGVAHFHHRFHRVIHLPAPWLGKKYLIPSQGRWALVVPHPQPGGRHVKYFFPTGPAADHMESKGKTVSYVTE